MPTLRTAAIAAACGGLGAGFALSIVSGAPASLILFYMAQLPLFVAGLWLGNGAALLASAAFLIALAAGADIVIALMMGAFHTIPVLLLTRQSLLARSDAGGRLEWYPPGAMTAWVTGLGVAALVLVIGTLGGPEAIRAQVNAILAAHLLELPSSLDTTELLGRAAILLPGAVALIWMLVTVVNGCLAQGLLIRFNRAWRPSPDFSNLALPAWIYALLALALGAAAIEGIARFVGLNMLMMLTLPFTLAGLAVMHAIARGLTHGTPALIALYLFSGLLVWPFLLIAFIGAAEPVLGLRRRFALPPRA